MTETDFRLMQEKFDAIDKRLDALQVSITIIESYIRTQLQHKYYGPNKQTTLDNIQRITGAELDMPCVWDSLSEEDRLKPMGISCPCRKCSPYSLSSGGLSDAGTEQTWREESV